MGFRPTEITCNKTVRAAILQSDRQQQEEKKKPVHTTEYDYVYMPKTKETMSGEIKKKKKKTGMNDNMVNENNR